MRYNYLLYGLLSIIIFSLSVLISITFKENYSFSGQYLSALGVGEYSYVFNTGLIITSFFIAVFFLYFLKIKRLLCKIGSIFGLISCVFLIGVALFPSGHQYHIITTSLFFLSLLISSFFISFSTDSIEIKLYELALIAATILFSYSYYIGIGAQIFQKILVFGYFVWILIISLKSINTNEELKINV